MTEAEEAALAAGATVLGDPPHYLLTAEQLARMVSTLLDSSDTVAPIDGVCIVPPPPY